jgi:small subunit ribosomal protein S6
MSSAQQNFPLCTATPLVAPQGKPGERRLEFTPMKRPYEVTFIVRLDNADENQVNNTIDQVRGWIEADQQGQVTRIDRWGRKKLAYEIDKQREGYYVLMESQIESQALLEIERNINLSPFILRYLVVRTED